MTLAAPTRISLSMPASLSGQMGSGRTADRSPDPGLDLARPRGEVVQTIGRANQIVRLRISLIGIEPEVWRRVEVPLDISVMHVHDVIQAVMGWHGSHLFEFHAGKKYYGIPDPDDIDFGRRVINAATARFRTLLASGGCEIGYVYDFGDYWEHRLAVEAIEPACPDRLYPRLLDGARRSPPEDVGGAHGYHEFLDAMTRPGHRMHRRMIEWYCGRYDPDDIDLSAIHRRLDKIARHGAARKAAKREREV